MPGRHSPLVIQKKLAMSEPGDPYEEEADRVADKVMRMPAPVVQRKTACPKGAGPACRDEEEKETPIRRKASARSSPVSDVPPIVHEVLQSPGEPLDMPMRAFFEPRFGHDFSRVRVHTDVTSSQAVQSINAIAFTVGNDIYLDRSQPHPSSLVGRFLLAHELSHVIQQRGAARSNSSDRVIRRGFPYLIAGAVAVIAASGYAWWAHNCLEPVNLPMYYATFGPDLGRRDGGFRLWYFNQTGRRPVPSRVWDAFGHCFVACAATKRCGSRTTYIAGRGREIYREYIDSAPHDSYTQDVNNQALGRSYGRQGADCEQTCRQASLHPGVMDLTAPLAQYWTPARGDYDATPEEIRADAERMRREKEEREQREQRERQEQEERQGRTTLEQHLRQQYQDCLRRELERPGGVPSPQEEAQARETCRQRTGYPQ
jgi:hypothetical protein